MRHFGQINYCMATHAQALDNLWDLVTLYNKHQKISNVYFIVSGISSMTTSTPALAEWHDGRQKTDGTLWLS